MSNRRSHFVHRLQTLPSALAGGPRRLPALAAVLALLALLALALLPTAAQAQADTTPPALASATVLADGTSIELDFDEPYNIGAAAGVTTTQFSVTADGSTVTVGLLGLVFDLIGQESVYRTVQLKGLSPTITHGQVVTVSYTDPTTGDDSTAVLQDAAGNDVASFTTGLDGVPAVVNNVPYAPTQYIASEIWSTTLTVKELSAGVSSGCRNAVTGKECSTLLDDDDFTYNGKTYQIVELQFAGDDLIIEFGIAPGDDVNSFELNADGRIYSFQNATMVTPEYFSIPLPASVPFTVDTVVMLSMTVPVETTPVPTTWSLVPSGLGDGDSFRLLFISTSDRDASSSDIADYNTFIQNLVDTNGHDDIKAHSATFRMLGSTEAVDARDNTGTTGTGVPIYWLNGAKVADDYADFYDGDWDQEATGASENGVSVSIGTDWKIWTGSAQDGTEAFHASLGTSRALGNAGNHWVMQGSPNGSDSAHGPIASNTASRTGNRYLYGLSGVFTVVDNTPPELERAAVTDALGNRILFLVYSEELDPNSNPAKDAFTVTVAGDTAELGVVVVSISAVQIGINSPVRAGQEVLVSYEPPAANPIQDLAGNAAAGFTVVEAKNNIVEWSVTFDPSTIAEDGGVSTVTVSTGGATFEDNKSITLTPAGTATESTDYTIGSKSLTLTAGDTEVTTTVTALADSVDDEPETVTLTAMLDADQIGETATLTITGIDPPGAPRNVAATAGTGKVRLTWQAPESQGGGVITGYEYQRKEGTGSFGSWTTAETVAFGSNSNSAILVDATTLDDYDVKAETTYTYRVRAVNAGGGGDASAEDSATTGAAMTVKVEVAEPEVFEDEGPVRVVVVAELPATGPNTEKYELEFNINFYNQDITAASIDDYAAIAEILLFAPGDFNRDGGRWVASKPFTVALDVDDLLEPDETFTVGVEKGGALRPSHPFITFPGATDTVTVTILNDDHLPVIPTEEFDVLLGETDAGQLPETDEDGDMLTWTLIGGDDQALFTLSTNGQLSLKVARTLLENPGDNNNDGVYELTVQVSDGHHTAVSGDITVKLVDKSLPSTPTGLRWKRAGDEGGRATLTWGPPADDGNRPILRYEIQTDAGAWETVPGGGAAREITFTNLNYNQRYIYNLRAVNEVGPSAETWTENVLLRPGAPGAPGNLTAEAVSPSEIRLSWQRPSHGPDIQIVGYYFEVSLDGRDWSYSNFLLDQEYEDTFGEEGSGDDEFRLDDEEPSTRDSIGRDAARHYRVSALSVYTPALSDDDPYEDGLTRGPASEPVRATTTETPASAKASGNPLTGFELVDATAHLDAGAVEDGATLTGIDPAKVYGFRANVASGAELKSVKLELSGPGPDDRVARTENYKPYSLYGDSDGHEHGAALPAGSYTLTATAYSEKDGGGSQLGTLSIEFTVTGGPLTARFLYEEPQGYHSGSGTTLTVRLSFSEAVSTTPEALRDHALEVTNATVEAVSRVDERSDLWEVRLTPESDATVTVAVSPATDCDAAGAVCTEDGRMLSVRPARVILGPPPNSAATGAPTISGLAEVGQVLRADVTGIRDDDGLDSAAFAYQWLRDDAEIAGATDETYTLTGADEGKTVKVTVSFTDAVGNPETLTSDPTGEVEAKPNTEPTGAPSIDGFARVGETLTADTSGIDDDDGLDSAAFAYQWLRGDAEIAGATGETYTLTGDDEGKTIKVTVSFTDSEGNPETLTSDSTGVVAAAETVPGRPQDLAGQASAQGIALTWTAPDGSVVTGYVVYRGKLQNGSMNGQPMTQYATIDATGANMAYTDGDVEAGAEYRYRVAAVNSAGEGKKSNWLDIAAGDSE